MISRHLLRIPDVGKPTLLHLLDRAEAFRADRSTWPSYPRLVLGLMFFAPSTRTLLGFQSAAGRLGGTAITSTGPKYVEGMSQPETFEDTVRAVSPYCDVLVVRHPEASALDRAASVSSVPVINAGNGTEEHPTQAIVDLFAIRRWHHRLTGLRIGIAGDLQSSRAAHSLVRALAYFDPAELRLMYPKGYSIPSWVVGTLSLPTTECPDRLELSGLDVLYMAGLPEGIGQTAVGDSVRAKLRLTPQSISELPDDAVVLSPLPRIDEIDESLDGKPNCRYFEQSSDGLFVRLAILEHLLSTV